MSYHYGVTGGPASKESLLVLTEVDDRFNHSVCFLFLIFFIGIFPHIHRVSEKKEPASILLLICSVNVVQS